MSAGGGGWLGDSIWRDYGRKLDLWNAFAEPELRSLLASLVPPDATRILDAGCGTGQASGWLRQLAPSGCQIFALDLARPHVSRARTATPLTVQADVSSLPFPGGTFDLVWSANTLHHVAGTAAVLDEILHLLRPGGTLAVGQSSYLPDMLFAWDARLERLTNEAVRAYYRDRYGRSEAELAGIRAWTGRLLTAGFASVAARTITIERISPLDRAAIDYIQECLFDNTFGGRLARQLRLAPYLPAEDSAQLLHLIDPDSPDWALARPDFHFLQTFTVTTGRRPSAG